MNLDPKELSKAFGEKWSSVKDKALTLLLTAKLYHDTHKGKLVVEDLGEVEFKEKEGVVVITITCDNDISKLLRGKKLQPAWYLRIFG